MAAPMISNLGRSIWKRIEPIHVIVALDTGKVVRLDLIDETGTAIQTAFAMAEAPDVPGIYVRTFTRTELDTLLDPNPTERQVLWRAYVFPADPNIPDRVGTFYRGGHVDLPVAAYAAPFDVRFAPVDVPGRFVVAGQVDTVDVPLGYDRAIRRSVVYRSLSGDADGFVDEEIPAP